MNRRYTSELSTSGPAGLPSQKFDWLRQPVILYHDRRASASGYRRICSETDRLSPSMPQIKRSQTFIKRNTCGGGKVEASNSAGSRDIKKGFGEHAEDRFRQTRCFRTENQKKFLLPGHLSKRTSAAFSEHNHFQPIRVHDLQEIRYRIPHPQIYLGPVVQTCALHFTTCQGKSKRFDQVQTGIDGNARPADIASIPVHLRRHQDHMSLKNASAGKCLLRLRFRLTANLFMPLFQLLVPLLRQAFCRKYAHRGC